MAAAGCYGRSTLGNRGLVGALHAAGLHTIYWRLRRRVGRCHAATCVHSIGQGTRTPHGRAAMAVRVSRCSSHPYCDDHTDGKHSLLALPPPQPPLHSHLLTLTTSPPQPPQHSHPTYAAHINKTQHLQLSHLPTLPTAAKHNPHNTHTSLLCPHQQNTTPTTLAPTYSAHISKTQQRPPQPPRLPY